MIHYFYTIVSVKDNSVHLSNPYKQNFSFSVLVDTARQLSIDNEGVTVSIYKHFLDNPSTVRLLYRFINGVLVRF